METVVNTGAWGQQVLSFIVAYKEAIGGIVVFLLLWSIIHRFRARFQPFCAASTENGSVFVGRATVIKLVQSACANIEGGSVKRVKCINKRRLLLLKLYVSLDVNQSFEVSSVYFQEAAKNAVTHCLGAMKNVRVDVILEGTEGVYAGKSKPAVSTGSFASALEAPSAASSESSAALPSETGDYVKSEED